MSVTGDAIPLYGGQTGKVSQDGSEEYVIVYQVNVSDPLDGPFVVCRAPRLPFTGMHYQIGNDAHPLAFWQDSTPTRSAESRLVWYVSARFSTATPENDDSGRDEDGNPTDDPEQRRWDISDEPGLFSVPMEQALNRTDLPGRAAGTLGPVTNSAGVVLDPPLEMEQSRRIIRITRWERSFPGDLADKFTCAINDKDYTLNKPKLKYRKFCKAFTLKCHGIGGSLTFIKNRPWWKITYEFHWWKQGWRRTTCDRGKHARAGAGDPNGRGGFISPSELLNGAPQIRRLRDAAGVPIGEDVLLDGRGQPLGPNLQPVYLTWSEPDAEQDFIELGL